MEVRMLKALKSIEFTDEKNIDWKQVAAAVPGASSGRFCKAKFEEHLKPSVPEDKCGSWDSLISWLLSGFEALHSNSSNPTILKSNSKVGIESTLSAEFVDSDEE